jgi:hypothetical protein
VVGVSPAHELLVDVTDGPKLIHAKVSPNGHVDADAPLSASADVLLRFLGPEIVPARQRHARAQWTGGDAKLRLVTMSDGRHIRVGFNGPFGRSHEALSGDASYDLNLLVPEHVTAFGHRGASATTYDLTLRSDSAGAAAR